MSQSAPGASWRWRAVALVAGLLVAACGEAPPPQSAATTALPADPAARARHCYLVLTLAIDQMAEFDAPGRQRGFVARQGADELLGARRRHAERLDEDILERLERDPWAALEALLAGFDADGDGQLATAAEVEAFNSDVAACARSG
jgi:hypothetical protein